MNQTVVSISDICIRASQSGVIAYSEPGIALLMPGEKTLLGQQAQNALRQQPTRINSRFWADLNTDAIQINNTPVRHNADLVWNQLSHIKTKLSADFEAISVCVPSNLNQQQLQLLTGICQSLELKVNSLINLGVAQIIGSIGPDNLAQQEITHIDLQLHQLVLTNYQTLDGRFEIKNQEIIQDISFLRFIDRVLNLLREKFIQSSRFDPLHSGDNEQQLFDQLIQMINSGKHTAFHVDTAQKQHEIELSTQDFSGLAQEFKQQLAERTASRAIQAYTPIFSQLPGFQFSDSDIRLKDIDTEQGAVLLNEQHSNTPETAANIVYIRNALLATGTGTGTGTGSLSEPEKSELTDTDAGDSTSNENLANAILFDHRVYQDNTSLIKAGAPEGLVSFHEHGITDSADKLLSVGDRLEIDDNRELLAVRIVD